MSATSNNDITPAFYPVLSQVVTAALTTCIVLFGVSFIVDKNFDALDKKVDTLSTMVDKKVDALSSSLEKKTTDINQNFVVLYGGFAISLALLTGFNSVADNFANIEEIRARNLAAKQSIAEAQRRRDADDYKNVVAENRLLKKEAEEDRSKSGQRK
jgi:hypothetical protein